MDSVAADTPPQPSRPGLVRAFSAPLRVFFAPESVLREIRDGLPWWPGLLILALVALALGLLLLPLQQQLMAMDISAGAGNMKHLELGPNGELPTSAHYTLLGGLIGGPLLGMPVLLIVTFFYWLALTITFGSAPYRRLFALTVYASFIGLAFQVLNSVYLRIADLELTSMKDLQSSGLKLSLGALMSGDGFLATFLGQIGVFQVWELIVFVSGVAVLTGRRRGAVAAPVLVVFLLGVAIMSFLAMLGARFSG